MRLKRSGGFWHVQKHRLNNAQASILWALMCRPKVQMEDIAKTIWPEYRMPDHWRSAIRVEVHALRTILAGFATIPPYRNGYTLNTASA